MKIAIVCYGHFDATIALARYLPRLDGAVDLQIYFLLDQAESICVENIDFRGFRLPNGFVSEETLQQALGPEFYEYLHPSVKVRAFIFNSIRRSDLKNISLLRMLRRHLESEKFDLIHFVGNNNDWIIKINEAIKGVPKVHTMHEPYPFSALSAYRRFRYRWTIQSLLNTKSSIVLPSKVSRSRLEQHYDTRDLAVRVIPFDTFDIYRQYGNEGIERDSKLLLYYGAISEYKGVPDLIEAMRVVGDYDQNINCIVAGRGHISQEIEIPANTKVINRYLTNTEIADLNRRASLVICPYRSASQSGVVMTSFAFGTPILATKVGAFAEMIEHGITGWLIEPNDKSALAKAILHLFANPTLLTYMQTSTASRHSTENWLAISQEHLELYAELAHTSKKIFA